MRSAERPTDRGGNGQGPRTPCAGFVAGLTRKGVTVTDNATEHMGPPPLHHLAQRAALDQTLTDRISNFGAVGRWSARWVSTLGMQGSRGPAISRRSGQS